MYSKQQRGRISRPDNQQKRDLPPPKMPDRQRDIYRRGMTNQDMYSSPPRVSLPFNYRGNAFERDGTSGHIYAPERQYSSKNQGSEPPREQVSEQDNETQAEDTENMEADERIEGDATPPAETPNNISIENAVSAVGRGILTPHGFPFGHGIGYEELLILGLILFLNQSADTDSEDDDTEFTKLLLLFLLLCG